MNAPIKNFIPQGSISVDRLQLMLSRIEHGRFAESRARDDLAKAVIFVAGNGDDVRKTLKRFMRGTSGFEATELTKSRWNELQGSLADSLKKTPISKIGLPGWVLYNSLVAAGATKLIESKDKWPRRLPWKRKAGGDAHNARIFVKLRPGKLISSNDVLYSLDSSTGIWTEMQDGELAAEIRATDPIDELDTPNIVSMVKSIHILTRTSAVPFTWIDPPKDAPDPIDLILFRNGILNFDTGELLPHDGRYFATAVPDYDYDPDAECPVFDKFLNDTLHSSFHPVIEEWGGYILTPDTRAHKMAAFIGASRAGKSTLNHVYKSLVGEKHYSSSTLADFGDSFGLENMQDKLYSTVPDADSVVAGKRSTALERIKSIVGGDEVSVNRKHLKVINRRLCARVAIFGNRMPEFIDESGALAKRLLVVMFERTFAGREDVELEEKLGRELSGIANRMLAGLARLRESGLKFTEGKAGRRAAKDIARSQSPALSFTETALVVTGDNEDFVSMQGIYSRYGSWTEDQGMTYRDKRTQMRLKDDLIAAHREKGVRYVQRRRVRRISKIRHGEAVTIKRKLRVWGLAGVQLQRDELDSESV